MKVLRRDATPKLAKAHEGVWRQQVESDLPEGLLRSSIKKASAGDPALEGPVRLAGHHSIALGRVSRPGQEHLRGDDLRGDRRDERRPKVYRSPLSSIERNDGLSQSGRGLLPKRSSPRVRRVPTARVGGPASTPCDPQLRRSSPRQERPRYRPPEVPERTWKSSIEVPVGRFPCRGRASQKGASRSHDCGDPVPYHVLLEWEPPR